ncbi:COG4315 family predicted lipoprotein [Streptomyces sp. NPDC001492]
MRRSRITVAGIALAGLALAGCGGGGGSARPAAATMNTSTIRTSHSPVGDILVDGGGRTLYLFTADGKNSNSMNCDATCMKLWPHMEGSPHAGAGVDANLVGHTKASGKPQVTYAGHPLYYYAKDRKAGDLKGQGVDRVWYVLNAKGTAVKKAVPTSNSGGGGYGY